MSTLSHHIPSLDAFRGLTIAGMILVDNPGNWTAVFAPLVHADWNGCTLADLVFPSFLFILGVAVPFAFARRRTSDETGHLYRRIVRRTAALIGLGLVLNAAAAWPMLTTLRIPGVLQRIGLVYLATALIVLHTSPRRRAVIIAGLLLSHWLVLAGGLHAGSDDLTPTHNVAAVVDRALFGSHLLAVNGDPEGLLGTMSATATALIGTLVGASLRARRPMLTGRLAISGLALTAVGYAWSWVLPLNKPLWTGSYALLSAGLAILGLTIFHVVLDTGDTPRWTAPLLWLGINPLAIYFASELARQALDRSIPGSAGQVTTASWLFWSVLRPAVPAALDDRWVALTYGMLVVAAWIAVAGLLERRQIRFQV